MILGEFNIEGISYKHVKMFLENGTTEEFLSIDDIWYVYTPQESGGHIKFVLWDTEEDPLYPTLESAKQNPIKERVKDIIEHLNGEELERLERFLNDYT